MKENEVKKNTTQMPPKSSPASSLALTRVDQRQSESTVVVNGVWTLSQLPKVFRLAKPMQRVSSAWTSISLVTPEKTTDDAEEEKSNDVSSSFFPAAVSSSFAADSSASTPPPTLVTHDEAVSVFLYAAVVFRIRDRVPGGAGLAAPVSADLARVRQACSCASEARDTACRLLGLHPSEFPAAMLEK